MVQMVTIRLREKEYFFIAEVEQKLREWHLGKYLLNLIKI